VYITQLELREFAETELELDVDCSKGTYVRSLAEDIGEALGCGAHLTALRRLRVGHLQLSQAVTLEALAADQAALDACLTPLAEALAHLPRHLVSDAEAEHLRHGQPLAAPAGTAEGWLAVFSVRRDFLGMVERVGGQLLPRRLVRQDG
jgi:tRNA pseudouridine55 synthase